MKPWEKLVKKVVKKGQIVDYLVSLIYQDDDQLIPVKIRMLADGHYRNGNLGIYFDRCLTTGVKGRDRINRGSC